MARLSARLASRVERLEVAAEPVGRDIGHVLRMKHGERTAQAIARLYPNVGIPRGHKFLVVPEKVTDATRDEFAARFKAQQLALIADANREIEAARRVEQEAGRTLVGPIAAALARQQAAALSNPYRPKP